MRDSVIFTATPVASIQIRIGEVHLAQQLHDFVIQLIEGLLGLLEKGAAFWNEYPTCLLNAPTG